VRITLHALLVLMCFSAPARAGDRLTVRGNYYREHSTRVLQPLVSFDKGLAQGKVGIGVDYALDAISSASIAAGSAALGGDVVFFESRHETAGRVSLKLDLWGAGTSYRYSTETDYQSHSASTWLSRELFARRSTVFASYTVNLNRAFRIRNNLGDRVPWTSSGTSNRLVVHHSIFSWTQLLSANALVGFTSDLQFARGPQDNPYRKVVSGLPESHPLSRDRIAAEVFARYRFPRTGVVLEPIYRYYRDDWQIQAHMAEMRVHARLFTHWLLRARYRFYQQNRAYFWHAPGAETAQAKFVTADPKMAAFHSHTPGISLAWEFDGLARHRKLDWLAGGWIQATYNHVFQTSEFPNARLGSLSFSLAF
jgi:hypothetical protein